MKYTAFLSFVFLPMLLSMSGDTAAHEAFFEITAAPAVVEDGQPFILNVSGNDGLQNDENGFSGWNDYLIIETADANSTGDWTGYNVRCDEHEEPERVVCRSYPYSTESPDYYIFSGMYVANNCPVQMTITRRDCQWDTSRTKQACTDVVYDEVFECE